MLDKSVIESNVDSLHGTEIEMSDLVVEISNTKSLKMEDTDFNVIDEKPFKCEYCPKSFKLSYILKTHIRTHTGEKPFECKICSKKFTQSGHLIEHSRTHTGEKPFHCTDCEKSYMSASHLKIHMRSHTGERPYSCKFCSKTFSHPNSIRFHIKLHTGEAYKYSSEDRKNLPNKHKCGICGTGFKFSHALKRHLFIHSGEKPFICDLCSKAFAQSSHLKEHLLTHTGGRKRIVERPKSTGRPYRCSECGARFAGLSALKSHAGKHTGKKPYKCGICGRGFTSQFFLTSHMRTHTGEKPYQCEICSKRFSQRSVLVRHLRTHNGDKRYGCDVCNKKFVSRSDLTKHIRTHTGERPYKCEFCSSCFSRSSHLTRHTKIHFVSKKTAKKSNSKSLNKTSLRSTSPNSELIKALNGTDLMTDQNGLIDFENISSVENTLNEPRNIVHEEGVCLNSDNMFCAGEYCKFQTLPFDDAQNNLHIKSDIQSVYGECNQFDHFSDIYIHTDSLNFDGEKIDKSISSDSMKKFAIVKNTSKWLNQNSNCHLKSSCEEVKLQTVENCNPWQCGICDMTFSEQGKLTTHVNNHSSDEHSVKYTKLVKNPMSGILEVKEVIPREKPKIIPKEELKPILDNFLLNKNSRNIIPKENKTLDELKLHCELSSSSNVINNFNPFNGNAVSDVAQNVSYTNFQVGEVLASYKSDFKTESVSEKSDSDINGGFSSDDEKPLNDLQINLNENKSQDKSEQPNSNLYKRNKLKISNSSNSPKCTKIEANLQSNENLLEPEITLSENPIEKIPKKPRNKGVKEFPCSDCPKIFKFSHALLVHSRCHTGIRPFVCKWCNQTFGQKCHLKQHERTHTGERPYVCWQCGASFSIAAHLNSHMMTHSGEKPFECDLCHKHFGNKMGLKHHQNIHTGETPYKCEHCGKGFRQPSSLKTHYRTHTGEKPYKCDFCARSFGQKSTLTAHRRIHTGERPYKCEVCQQGFSSRSDLKKHYVTHSEDRPYVCTITPTCRKAFNRNSHLKRHMETHKIVESIETKKEVQTCTTIITNEEFIVEYVNEINKEQ